MPRKPPHNPYFQVLDPDQLGMSGTVAGVTSRQTLAGSKVRKARPVKDSKSIKSGSQRPSLDSWTDNHNVVYRQPTRKHYARNPQARERAMRVRPDTIVRLGPKPIELTIVQAARQAMSFLKEMNEIQPHDALLRAQRMLWLWLADKNRLKDAYVRRQYVERIDELSASFADSLHAGPSAILQTAASILQREEEVMPSDGIRSAADDLLQTAPGSKALIALAKSVLKWTALKKPQLAYKQDVYRFRLAGLLQTLDLGEKALAAELSAQLGGQSVRGVAVARRPTRKR